LSKRNIPGVTHFLGGFGHNKFFQTLEKAQEVKATYGCGINWGTNEVH